MRSLGALSARSLLRRRGRYALTAAGTALGVAVVFGVLVTTNATTSALDRMVDGAAGRADVEVSPVGAFDATMPASVERRIAARPGVVRTSPSLSYRARLGNQPGARSAFGGDMVFVGGVRLRDARAVSELRLVEGRFFRPGAAEVVLPRSLADELDLRPGTGVTVSSPSGRRLVVVTGVLDDVGGAAGNGGRLVLTSLSAARRLHGSTDRLTSVAVVLEEGTDTAAWLDAHRDALGRGVTVQDARDVAAGFRGFVSAITGALGLVAAIALFVGGFLVFLTFSLSVAERTRTYGTLRALGAHPRQVRRVVVVEAALLGVAAGAVGLVLGYGLALAALGLVERLLLLELPSLGLPVVTAAVTLALAVATCVVAAWLPARQAAALGPVDAMRDAPPADTRPARAWVGIALMAVGAPLGGAAPSTALRNAGVLLLLLGAVLVVPALLRPLARLLGRLTARVAPGVGDIAVMHLVKERSRSAYTLALVMVVLALLLSVGASNLAMRRTLDGVLARQWGSDVQVWAPGAFDDSVGLRLAAIPGVEVVTPLRVGNSELVDGDGPRPVPITVIEPATYFRTAGFSWVDGDDGAATDALAGGGSVLVADPLAWRLGVERGETVDVRTSKGVRPFRVAGTYAAMGPGPGLVAGARDAALFGAGRPNGYFVDVADDALVESVMGAMWGELGHEHELLTDTPADVRASARRQLQGFFSMAYVLLALAAVTGFLGLANTLVVSVLTRRREIGMLRSVGVLARQVRGMVLVESATLALVAIALALPLAWVMTMGLVSGQKASLGFTVDFLYPWALVPIVGVAAMLVAGMAALLPARRAGRLEPVAALRFD